MDAHLLDDGDLGAVVRAGFSSSSKPFPVHPPYPSPTQNLSVCLSPATSPLPAANPSPKLSSSASEISPLSSTAPAFPCFQTPSGFGLPPLCDLLTPSSISPHHSFSALSQSLSLVDSLSSPSSLPPGRRFDYGNSAASIFTSTLGHPASVKQLDLSAPGSFSVQALSQAPQSTTGGRALQTRGKLFTHSFLQHLVGEDPRFRKLGHSSSSSSSTTTSVLSDITALSRDVPVSLGQPTGVGGGHDQLKNLVECELSTCAAAMHAPYKARGAKKRKALQKRVVYIPASTAISNRPGAGENVPSDLWAWRKYGQKPIKGSPHPRGYYRCSSSKGCPARKQVERNPSDPSMLVVTYTSDHNHPWPTHRINALAGSTRQASSATTSSQEKSPSSNNELSPDECTVANDMEDEPAHSDDLMGDASMEEAAGAASSESKAPMLQCNMTVSQSSSQQELVVSDGLVYEGVGPAQLGVTSSCAVDDPYLQESMFEEMVEEMQRQNRGSVEEEVVVVEEGVSLEVDPFNLFNWSSSPNNVTSFNKVNDVAQ